MGLLDKLKAAKNFVTGGSAKISIEVGHSGRASLGAAIPVVVRAVVGDNALSVNRVYVQVSAEEFIDLVHIDRDDGEHDRDRVRKTYETFDQEFVIAGTQSLEPGTEHEWVGEITLPPSAQATYMGHHARHEWSFRAGLDVRGNDPDSGWVTVHMSAAAGY
ncbi:MAG: hypothetical protein AAGC55_19920 [Myxococcota bacterium]